jgi:hypothetical protein
VRPSRVISSVGRAPRLIDESIPVEPSGRCRLTFWSTSNPGLEIFERPYQFAPGKCGKTISVAHLRSSTRHPDLRCRNLAQPQSPQLRFHVVRDADSCPPIVTELASELRRRMKDDPWFAAMVEVKVRAGTVRQHSPLVTKRIKVSLQLAQDSPTGAPGHLDRRRCGRNSDSWWFDVGHKNSSITRPDELSPSGSRRGSEGGEGPAAGSANRFCHGHRTLSRPTPSKIFHRLLTFVKESDYQAP